MGYTDASPINLTKIMTDKETMKEVANLMSKAAGGRAVPEKLTMVHAHQLVSLMLEQDRGFTAKRLSYAEYAKFASHELGFAITGAQVSTRVREFSIPHGAPVRVETNLDVLAATVLRQSAELIDLQERLTRLEGWVNTTFPSKSPLKVVG